MKPDNHETQLRSIFALFKENIKSFQRGCLKNNISEWTKIPTDPEVLVTYIQDTACGLSIDFKEDSTQMKFLYYMTAILSGAVRGNERTWGVFTV